MMAGQRAEGARAPVADTGALEAIETSRRRLHDLLLDTVRAMGGANRRLPEAGGQAAELCTKGAKPMLRASHSMP